MRMSHGVGLNPVLTPLDWSVIDANYQSTSCSFTQLKLYYTSIVNKRVDTSATLNKHAGTLIT